MGISSGHASIKKTVYICKCSKTKAIKQCFLFKESEQKEGLTDAMMDKWVPLKYIWIKWRLEWLINRLMYAFILSSVFYWSPSSASFSSVLFYLCISVFLLIPLPIPPLSCITSFLKCLYTCSQLVEMSREAQWELNVCVTPCCAQRADISSVTPKLTRCLLVLLRFHFPTTWMVLKEIVTSSKWSDSC